MDDFTLAALRSRPEHRHWPLRRASRRPCVGRARRMEDHRAPASRTPRAERRRSDRGAPVTVAVWERVADAMRANGCTVLDARDAWSQAAIFLASIIEEDALAAIHHPTQRDKTRRLVEAIYPDQFAAVNA